HCRRLQPHRRADSRGWLCDAACRRHRHVRLLDHRCCQCASAPARWPQRAATWPRPEAPGASVAGGPVTTRSLLIPIALFLGALGLAGFLWALRSGQYDDMDGAAERILIDDEEDR